MGVCVSPLKGCGVFSEFMEWSCDEAEAFDEFAIIAYKAKKTLCFLD